MGTEDFKNQKGHWEFNSTTVGRTWEEKQKDFNWIVWWFDENVSHRFCHLNICFRGEFGGAALFEEVHYWTLRINRLVLSLVFFLCLVLLVQGVRSQMLFQLYFFLLPSWNHKPKYLRPSVSCIVLDHSNKRLTKTSRKGGCVCVCVPTCECWHLNIMTLGWRSRGNVRCCFSPSSLRQDLQLFSTV